MRSDSLAIPIAMAAASTASPASCPPIMRGSSGSDEAVEVAFVTFRLLCPTGLLDDGVELGVTVGNKLLRPPGVTVVPGSPGVVVGNGPGTPGDPGTTGDTVGEGLAGSSTAEIVASAGDSAPPRRDLAEPWTITVRPICSPAVAFLPIWSVTSTSSAWNAGSEPIEHVVL